ncbi:MAG: hypothetical protein ACKKL5_01545 [Candidatus Komeilibacteria bacterium]
MLETSKDLLNIVIAFCILWFTVFICWFIYYVVNIMRRVSDTMDQVAKMSASINDFFGAAKLKMEQATSYLPLLFEGVEHLTSYFKGKNKTAKTENKKTQRKKQKS